MLFCSSHFALFYEAIKMTATITPLLDRSEVAQMCYTSLINLDEVSMTTVTVRKQGGAAIITIPAHVLETLHIEVGAKLLLDVTKQGVMIKPMRASHRKRRRYTLAELLKGCTPKRMKALMKETEWIRELKPVGRERF